MPAVSGVTGKDYDVSYKTLLLGESGVGKTAISRCLVGETFIPSLVCTVGMDFVKKRYEIDGAQVQIQVWDTAGQERFRSITKFQYRGTKGLLLVYDVTCLESFRRISYWLESIDREIDKNTQEPIPVILVGNKCDLEESRVVSTEEGRKEADKHFVHAFFETSAKTGDNVQKVFSLLAEAVLEVNHPKLMTAYLSPKEQRDRETRKLSGTLLSAGKPSGVIRISRRRIPTRCKCG